MKIANILLLIFLVAGCSLTDSKEDLAPINEPEVIDDWAEDEIIEDTYSTDEPTEDEWAEERQELVDEYTQPVGTPEEPMQESQEEISSLPSGKFSRLKTDCWVRVKPRGKKMHVLPKGKRLWVEEPDPGLGWYQVYTKRSLAYMSTGCFND